MVLHLVNWVVCSVMLTWEMENESLYFTKLCSCFAESSLKCHVGNKQYAVQEIWITKHKWCYFCKKKKFKKKLWEKKINCLLCITACSGSFFITDGITAGAIRTNP